MHVEEGGAGVPLCKFKCVRVVTMKQTSRRYFLADAPEKTSQPCPTANRPTIWGDTDPMPTNADSRDFFLGREIFGSVEGMDDDLMTRFHQPTAVAEHSRIGCTAIGDNRLDADHGHRTTLFV